MKDKKLPPSLACVVVPCHNKEDTIKRSIDSIKKQTLNNLECIVVDDRSSDNSKEVILAEISDDRRFRYERIEFGNVAMTRNFGIGLSDAPFISTIDGDDWIEPTFLETCIDALEKDSTIGIAYTGLQTHSPEGEIVLQVDKNGNALPVDSWWPGAYIAEKQFNYEARGNQIPTCCVFRRDAWERVGGYRSRYCPTGAGSEDAAMWAQILSIGYTAKKVSNELMFNYQQGGHTSNKGYREKDWLSWLPFSRDKRYPFACSVLPQRYSHPVRQYDEPELSIIIPVGPGHEGDLRTALDSVEAQHFRNWETVVILDTGNEHYPELYAAYPYVKWGQTDGKRGPGYARNRGAEMARGKFLLFLDADDFLNPNEPNSLGEMLEAYWETGNGIYSAHIGRAVISAPYAEKMDREHRLVAWNDKLGQAYILNHGVEFDCEKAFSEPGDDPDEIYIWNLISTLIPRQWHFDIGGFDEDMLTWEDWDYWLRMAKGGRCFTRLQKSFIIYNYISGTRRQIGRQIWADVLQYLKDKHNKVKIMGCGCGGKKRAGKMSEEPNNDTHVWAWYIHPNVGKHDIGFDLGRHHGGRNEKLFVPRDIAESNPAKFEIAQDVIEDPVPQPETMPDPQLLLPPEPVNISNEFPIREEPEAMIAIAPESLVEANLDFSGLRPEVQNQLVNAGLTSKEAIHTAGLDGLILLKGIGAATAKQIMGLAE